jgi:hypothetical protein
MWRDDAPNSADDQLPEVWSAQATLARVTAGPEQIRLRQPAKADAGFPRPERRIEQHCSEQFNS